MRLLALLALLVPLTAQAKPRWQTLPLPPQMPKAASTGAVTVGGASIYYARYGQADREPVVLLHGGLGNADHFSFQLPGLAEKFAVIAIDSRGQGRSTLGTKPLTYHQMAEDVVAVLDQLKIPRASFVGWSDGGVIALDLAIHRPERVTKIFVVGANYDVSGSKPRKSSPPTFVDYAIKCRTDYRKIAKNPKAYDASAEALRKLWKSNGAYTKEQMRSIKAPAVIASGDNDELINLSHAEEMSKLIPKGRLVVFEDASHFVMWQDPKAFGKAVLDFLVEPATK